MAEYDSRTIERFWSKVDKNGKGGCWTWLAGRNAHGYGLFGLASQGRWRKRLAHRVAWMIANGPFSEELKCLHRCDNPPCVNPDHIFLGTQADNVADAVRKGRQRGARGEQSPVAKLNRNAVIEIREAIALRESLRSIARRFGVRHQSISGVKSGKSWRHVA